MSLQQRGLLVRLWLRLDQDGVDGGGAPGGPECGTDAGTDASTDGKSNARTDTWTDPRPVDFRTNAGSDSSYYRV